MVESELTVAQTSALQQRLLPYFMWVANYPLLVSYLAEQYLYSLLLHVCIRLIVVCISIISISITFYAEQVRRRALAQPNETRKG